MADATHVLVHVRQRLDALTFDGQSQYLLSSLPVVSAFQPPVVQTDRRRLTFCGSVLWYAGLTSFYFRLVLLLGTGWLLALVASVTYLYTLPAAQEDIALISATQGIFLLGINFLGGGLGCLFSGVSADYYGRRPVLLTALSFWLVINALTAGAWNYASLVTLRLFAGVGIGAQLPLLAILALEHSPTRTRGTITVLSVSFAGLGGFTGVGYSHIMSLDRSLGWRVPHVVLSALALVVVAVFCRTLEESPPYLASVGRIDEALSVLTRIETEHGISRPMRVTIPTSLYEPPSQRPRSNYEQYLESFDATSNFALELLNEAEETRSLSFQYSGPGVSKAHSRSHSQRVSTSGVQTPSQIDESTHPSDTLRIPSDTFGVSLSYNLTSGPPASFRQALNHRVQVLLSSSLARRTAVIWFVWFAELACSSGAIVTLLKMAQTCRHAHNSDVELLDQLVWSILPFPGLLITAAVIEKLGRRVTFGVFVVSSGITIITSAWVLQEDREWIAFSFLLGTVMLTTGGTLGALIPLTSEQFPLVTRALGISSAAAWGHVGVFTGVSLGLRWELILTNATWQYERWTLVGCGAAIVMLLPLILVMGPEPRGRDIDVVEVPATPEVQSRLNRALSATSNEARDGAWSQRLDNALERFGKEEASKPHVNVSNATRRMERARGRREKHVDRCRHTEKRAIVATAPDDDRLSSDDDNYALRHSVLERLEPILLEWRQSVSSLSSGSTKVDLETDGFSSHGSESGRYTFDLDMFDTFTYISTPVLGGDNCSDRELRNHSSVSLDSSHE